MNDLASQLGVVGVAGVIAIMIIEKVTNLMSVLRKGERRTDGQDVTSGGKPPEFWIQAIGSIVDKSLDTKFVTVMERTMTLLESLLEEHRRMNEKLTTFIAVEEARRAGKQYQHQRSTDTTGGVR